MIRTQKIYFYAFFAITAALTGCASDDSFIHTKGNDSWQLNGKIGLVYPEANCGGEDCRMQSDQGSIKWQQQLSNYAITLSDPFGRVVMKIDGNAQSLQARSPQKAPIQTTPNEFVAIIANNANNPALSTLSPAWLSYWVAGRAAPNLSVADLGSNQFSQAGYKISARQWRQTPVGNMPSLITIIKDKFKLRLVVREWSQLPKK